MKLDVKSNTAEITPGAIAPKAFSFASGGGGGGGGGINFMAGAGAKGTQFDAPVQSVGTIVLDTLPVTYPGALLNALFYIQGGGYANAAPPPPYGWEWHSEQHYQITYDIRVGGVSVSQANTRDASALVTFSALYNGLPPTPVNITIERTVSGYIHFFTSRTADPDPVPPQPAPYDEDVVLNGCFGSNFTLFVYPQIP